MNLREIGFAAALFAAAAPDARELSTTRWTLANGLEVAMSAAGKGGPHITLMIDAGHARDSPDAIGAAEMTIGAMTQGAAGMAPLAVNARVIGLGGSLDGSIARDYALLELELADVANLEEGLSLLAQLASMPGFEVVGLERVSRLMTEAALAGRWDERALIERALPLHLYGAEDPRAGLADVWAIRPHIAAKARPFYARHYSLDASLLVVSGVAPDTVLPAIERTFGALPRKPRGVGQQVEAPEMSVPVGGRLALVDAEVEVPRLLWAPIPEVVGTDPLERWVLLALVADRLGRPGATGVPLPPSGIDRLEIDLDPALPSAKALAGILAEIGAIAERGPDADRLGRMVEMTERRLATSFADSRFTARWIAAAARAGVEPDPKRALAAVSADDIREAASAIVGQRAWTALVVGKERRRRGFGELATVTNLNPLPSGTPVEGEAVARGRAVLEAAIGAQGGIARMSAIEHLEESSRGNYYGIDTAIPIKRRVVVSPPSLILLESVMYRDERYVTTRVLGDDVYVDRYRLPGMTGEYIKGPVVRRQVLRHPALALIRPYLGGLYRHVATHGEGESEVDEIEVLDPAVGTARCWIRRTDGALIRLVFDLLPLDASVEEHNFADFADVDGLRLPLSTQIFVRQRPHQELCQESIRFPEFVEPGYYSRFSEPDGTVWE